MSRIKLFNVFAVLIASLIVLLLAGCGGSGRKATMNPGLESSLAELQASAPVSIEQALAELDALSTPEGVDAQLFQELKGELTRQLNDKGDGKFACTPPTGEINKVTDLAALDNGDGTFDVTWRYRNSGDYDQSGAVGISDITPIAMHYGETYTLTDVNCLLAVIDGSANGEIDIADITPIAMYYATDCARYSIQTSEVVDGPFTEVLSAPMNAATGDGRKVFDVELPGGSSGYACVVPYDGAGTPGTGSNVVPIPEPSPVPRIFSVIPTSGDSGNLVMFAATVSGQEPLTYAWDFGGGAKSDTSSEVAPWVVLGEAGNYSASLTVSNAHGEDTLEFSLTVNPSANPPAVISVSPERGATGTLVPISAVVTGTPPITYAWNFGWGATPNTTNEAEPTVTLGVAGSYSAKLTVANAYGSDDYDFTLNVELPPTITGVTPTGGDAGEAVTFSATVEGTPPFTYEWDFGGGATPNTSTDEEPHVIMGLAGIYEASLNVTNVYDTDIFSFTITLWHVLTVDSADNVGYYTSLAVINGNPAISYFDQTNYNLKYVRAGNADGSSWGAPITVDSAVWVGSDTSLAIVNGNPAISYYDCTNEDLKYVRASDASGSAWDAPLTVDSAGNVGYWASLVVVSGNPAISYLDLTNRDLKYVRASDASGGSWGTPLTLDSAGQVGWYTSLAVVNGYPAISYWGGGLKYVRASDASGGSWSTPVFVDIAGEYTSLAVVNGNPAISYYDNTNDDLKYVRASDASGGSWSTPVTVDSAGRVGEWTSLAVVNGNPAISYMDYTNRDLKYARATDASGGSWGTPLTVDSWTGGYFTSLAVVNGNPAISYYGNGHLKFAICY